MTYNDSFYHFLHSRQRTRITAMNISFGNLLYIRTIIVAISLSFVLAGCIGQNNNGGGAINYSLGGTVTGLNGSVVLQNNAGSSLTVSTNGSFSFPTQSINSNFYAQVANSGTYNVSIISQTGGQNCVVGNGTGLVSAGSNIGNISVTCTTNYYSIGGTATGLNEAEVLQNNNGDNLTVPTSGTFTFPTQLTYNSPYSVTVLPPTGEFCTVSSGVGTVSNNNISNVLLVCSTSAYQVGVTVSGINSSTGLVLLDNNVDKLSVSANGLLTFFATKVADTSPYTVSLLSPPGGQNCSITNGSGTISGRDVTNVLVTCKNVIIAGSIQTNRLSLSGTVTTYAGSGSAGAQDVSAPLLPTQAILPTQSEFNNPSGITTDGTNLYIADTFNNQIRMITLLTRAVSTFAGSGSSGSIDSTVGTSATFNKPAGITTDGTNLYVADTFNNKIRMIVIATGAVTTLAGSGASGSADSTVGTSATFNNPAGITTDGTNLYVADTLNNKIRMIVIATGAVTTLAGSGASGSADSTAGTSATFYYPAGITTNGINLYVADTNNHKIREISISTGAVSTLAGFGTPGTVDNNIGTLAYFNSPRGITTDGFYLYVADTLNQTIREIAISTGSVTTLAGIAGTSGSTDNTGNTASFYNPSGITTDGASLYLTDTSNNKIRQIN